MDSSLRYFGSAVGFAFGAVWMTVGIGSAIVCLLVAALGYGAVFATQRAQANGTGLPSRRETPVEALDLDDGHHDPTDDATSPLAAEEQYGWPWPVEKPELAGTEGR